MPKRVDDKMIIYDALTLLSRKGYIKFIVHKLTWVYILGIFGRGGGGWQKNHLEENFSLFSSKNAIIS